MRVTRTSQTGPAHRELTDQPAGLSVCTCVPHVPTDCQPAVAGLILFPFLWGVGFGSAKGMGPTAQQQGCGAKVPGSNPGPNAYQMCREVLMQLGPDGSWDPGCLVGAHQLYAEHLPPFWGLEPW